MSPQLGRLILYVKDPDAVAAFYCTHFGYETRHLEGDRIVELVAQDGGANLLLHPLGAGRKAGQTLVKLVFDVADVAAFCESAAARGLAFGSIHSADGYSFANAKDPAGNSVSVSSRAFVQR